MGSQDFFFFGDILVSKANILLVQAVFLEQQIINTCEIDSKILLNSTPSVVRRFQLCVHDESMQFE
jgi:hypothetical protein